jgi:type IV pilus assembly protein PilC
VGQFYYGVRDGQGLRQSGVITAPSPGEAMARLRERFPLVLRLDAVSPPRQRWWGRQRVSDDDLLAFTHQLAAMLDAGLSFGKSMEVLLLDQVHRAPMRRVLVQIAAGVSEGRAFSDTLRSHPDVFPDLYASMVEAGETSANVPEVLRRLADHLTRTARVKMEVVSALLYPAIVLGFGVLVSATVLIYGAPILQQMYQGAGLKLPWLSQAFIWLGSVLGHLAPLLILLAAAGVILAPRLLASRLFRDRMDYVLIKLGPLRDILLEAAVARCCRTLSTLYGGGVPILKAIEMTALTAGNAVMRDIFLQVRDRVAGGSNLSAPLFASPLFPPMAAGMITAGEAAGQLPQMLEHLADYYEVRLDFALKAFSKGAEPVLIVGVGMLVGIIILALGLPLMNLVSVLN